MDWTRVRFDWPSAEFAAALGEIANNRLNIPVLAAHRDRHPSIWHIEEQQNGAAYIYFSPGADALFGPGLPAHWDYEICDAPNAATVRLSVGDARDWAHYGFVAPGDRR